MAARTAKPTQAGAKTADQMVGDCYGRFERAVTEQADQELAALHNNRDLTQQLTDAFDTYLNSRTATQDLMDSFMTSQGSEIVYDFAQEQGLALFYTFGHFSYGYHGGQLSISGPSMEGLDDFISDIREKCVGIVSYGMGQGGQNNEAPISGEDLYDITLQKLAEIFNESIGYQGSEEGGFGSRIPPEELERGRLPIFFDVEHSCVCWSHGVLSAHVSQAGDVTREEPQ